MKKQCNKPMCEDKALCFSEDCPLKESPLDRLVMKTFDDYEQDELERIAAISYHEITAEWFRKSGRPEDAAYHQRRADELKPKGECFLS